MHQFAAALSSKNVEITHLTSLLCSLLILDIMSKEEEEGKYLVLDPSSEINRKLMSALSLLHARLSEMFAKKVNHSTT